MGFRQRPEAAFESLYSRHVRDVYGYALGVLGSSADAEDVTQTTFLNAYRALQSGQRPRTPRSWLFAIAHNVCRQRFRQAARRPREVELHDGFAVEEGTDTPSASDIARALQSLPFSQRSALVMRELEGRSQGEIAEALGVSVSAVETLLFRARRGMREQLESALTCGEAARAISRQLDGASSRAERAALRAHLRVCDECATFARRARARQGALRRMRGALPLPASLLSWSLGGGTVAAPAGGLGLKLLAGTAVVALAAGATEETVIRHHPPRPAAAPRHAAVAGGVRAVARGGGAPTLVVAGSDLEPAAPRGHARAVSHGDGKTRGRGAGHGKARGHKHAAGRGHAKAAKHGRGRAKAARHGRERADAVARGPSQGAARRAAAAARRGAASLPARTPRVTRHAAARRPAKLSPPGRSRDRRS